MHHHDGLVPRVYEDIALLRVRLEHRELFVGLQRALVHGRAAIVGGGGRRSETSNGTLGVTHRVHTPFGVGALPAELSSAPTSPTRSSPVVSSRAAFSPAGGSGDTRVAPTDPSIELDAETVRVVRLVDSLRFAEACGFVDFVVDRSSTAGGHR